MTAGTTLPARGLSADERRARVAAMVENGEITAEQAALLDFRDPPEYVQEHAKRLSLARQARGESLIRAATP